MRCYLSILLALTSFSASPVLCAANKPHAVRASQIRPTRSLVGAIKAPAGPASDANLTWTNDDLQRLSRTPGLISIVGPSVSEPLPDLADTAPESGRENSAWYGAQSALLHARLDADEARLANFIQALNDGRELNFTTPGISLGTQDPGVTPDATVEILQNRVHETESKLDALEDLARRNGVAPGVLRGQMQGIQGNATIQAAGQAQANWADRRDDQ